MSIRILFITPPMTQLNTPYPATAYLTGFLRERGIPASQADLSLELMLRILSREGLEAIHARVASAIPPSDRTSAIEHFLSEFPVIRDRAPAAVRFLQGRDSTIAVRIASRGFLPEGPRFEAIDRFREMEAALYGGEPEDHEGLSWAFGRLGVQDRAKFLATLFIDDIADVVRDGIDPRFGLSRYGEKLAASQASFDPLLEALNSPVPTLIDEWIEALALDAFERAGRPEVVGLTAPFPGNVYGAFRIARALKKASPSLKVLFGGGYANTELRSLKDPRVFDFFDAIPLDDGERPLLCWLEHLQGARPLQQLLRTFVRVDGGVVYANGAQDHDIPHRDAGTPTYDGLRTRDYLSVLEMLNPMHRLWSDGRWNKLTLAHGCYWKKCSFCDVSLDYIGRYDAAPGALIVDRMEAIARETGETGFHFVDEAAPPSMLRAISEELLRRGLSFTWWGNVRFEKAFTPELAQLMAQAGCVAVSGGLEVASDRLLKKMNKGVTVEQVAQVTHALTNAGIMVHAYLMFGFPTQTAQETVDALERVRQLFAEGCIQSAFWHRFSATIHSPIGRDPGAFGIRLTGGHVAEEIRFAQNDLQFEDPTGVDHDFLGEGLRKALYNYMLGLGLDDDVRTWFGSRGKKALVPRAEVPRDLVRRALAQAEFRGLSRRNQQQSSAGEASSSGVADSAP